MIGASTFLPFFLSFFFLPFLSFFPLSLFLPMTVPPAPGCPSTLQDAGRSSNQLLDFVRPRAELAPVA
jgi:hypothetical protein